MSFDIGRIEKASRRIDKFLKKNPKNPTARDIHRLRAGCRSVETAFTTLGLDSKRRVASLLRDLKTARKGAGKVRDMDVLTANALSLQDPGDGEEECLVQLLEHLGAQRSGYAADLRRAIKKAGSELRYHLKRNIRRAEKRIEKTKGKSSASSAVPATVATTMRLSAELQDPARLNKDTLHPYRLKVKELRDVLELADEAGDPKFLTMLGEVKDVIGEWHDWQELIATAREALDHGPSCKLIKHMTGVSDFKFKRALVLTDQLREKYLSTAARSKRRNRQSKTGSTPDAIVSAIASIAEN